MAENEKVKPARYRTAIEWLALNEEAEGPYPEWWEQEAEGLVSICLVADLFGVSTEKVKRDVLRWRAKNIWLNK